MICDNFNPLFFVFWVTKETCNYYLFMCGTSQITKGMTKTMYYRLDKIKMVIIASNTL